MLISISIKIADLIQECHINDSDMEEFKECHPKQVIIYNALPVPVWKILYSYTTQRNNNKEAVKYIIGNEQLWDRVEQDFHSYIEDFNEKHPERKVSNVKILDTFFLGTAEIELE